MASELGKTIAEARRRRGWSQARLAEEAGLSIDWVRQVEQGRIESPRLAMVEVAANALGVKIDALVTGELPPLAGTAPITQRSAAHTQALDFSRIALESMTEEKAIQAQHMLRVLMAMSDDEFQNPKGKE